MKLVLAASSSADQFNRSLTQERLVNCYAVPAPEGANTAFEIRNVPGTRSFTTLPGPFFRAMRAVEGVLYAVSRAKLYSIAENGTVNELAAVNDDLSTSMSANRAIVTIAADTNYYIYDGSVSSPGDGRLTDVSSVAFLDGYTFLTETEGREVEWTTVQDPETRDALFFATAEARDDKIVRGMDCGSHIVVLKERSSEIWGNTGLGGVDAFARVEGAVAETGLAGFNLVCKTRDGLFAVGHDNVAYLYQGGQLSPVSNPAVNNALAQNDPTHCFYYEDRGAQIACIRFSDIPAWCVELGTGLWHERSQGTAHDAWDVIASEYCYGQWHFADRLGRVYRLGIGPWDADGPMVRTIVSREAYFDGDRRTVRMLEFLGRFGHGEVLETGPNVLLGENGLPLIGQDDQPLYAEADHPGGPIRSPARIVVRVSRDGGNLWSLPKIRGIGTIGQYETTARFRAMGQYRRMTVEINMSDAAITPLFAEANITVA